VRLAEESEVSIDTLILEQLQNIDSRFDEDGKSNVRARLSSMYILF
jgi:hypothetical protein